MEACMLFPSKRGWRVRIGLMLCGACLVIIAASFGLIPARSAPGDKTVPMMLASAAGITGVYMLAGPIPALFVGASLSFAGCSGGGAGSQDLGEPPEPPSALP